MNENIKYLLLNGGMGFISSLIRVLHNYHKDGKWNWRLSITRVLIGSALSYFASLWLPIEILARGMDLRGPSIFIAGFFGVELLDFFVSKDMMYFVNLFIKTKTPKE